MSIQDALSKAIRYRNLVESSISSIEANHTDSFYMGQSSQIVSLDKLARLYEKYQSIQISIQDLLKMSTEQDDELRDLADNELRHFDEQMVRLKEDILKELVIAKRSTETSLLLEIRPGVGGEEAALFASEIFDLYRKYANRKGWSFEIKHIATSDTGGLRCAIVGIDGCDSYHQLQHESGVHRVQRVPKTESAGRVHTSTVSIAILPTSRIQEVCIQEKDLKIEYFKSGGPGGQHVNTTNSAVRVTHLPTQIIVSVQEERNAHQNKLRAIESIKTKLMENQIRQANEERNLSRSSQIGQSSRSEKIRTYNFPQCRITDHRTGTSIHDFKSFFEGELLDRLIEEIIALEEGNFLRDLEGGKG